MCTLCGNANKLGKRPGLLQAREAEQPDEEKKLEQSNSAFSALFFNSLFYISYFLPEQMHQQPVV